MSITHVPTRSPSARNRPATAIAATGLPDRCRTIGLATERSTQYGAGASANRSDPFPIQLAQYIAVSMPQTTAPAIAKTVIKPVMTNLAPRIRDTLRRKRARNRSSSLLPCPSQRPGIVIAMEVVPIRAAVIGAWARHRALFRVVFRSPRRTARIGATSNTCCASYQ